MAKKTLILIRHGQYHKASEKGPERLTTLGRKQAEYVSKRLKEYSIDSITHSTMPRAKETASIIQTNLKFRKRLKSCKEICECVPGFPKNLRIKAGFTDEAKLKSNIEQADRAFKKHFKKPVRNSTDVLVCHGNMIRYLICRALDINTLIWTKLDIYQCGISIIELRSEGPYKKMLLSHNDIGHIPKQKRTFL